MIPVKLSLRNFMCYRENVPPIDFNGIYLACLWGDNGNGKSALIDAMTWALWGKSRAIKSDDDLIYTNATEMEVEFDFSVGGQTCRVIRKHSRPKHAKGSGKSSLDFLIAGDNGFKQETGDSISQTQKKIIDRLHMEYETFVNSAFLRQGHADEFTLKKPAERKQVLADILGLSFYDELEKRAKDLTREQDAQKALLENAIREIDEELVMKPSFEAELAQVQLELARTGEALAVKDAELKNLRQQKEALAQKESQLQELKARLDSTSNDMKRWQEQLQQHRSRIKEYEELLARRAAIEDAYNRFLAARKSKEELDAKSLQSANLATRKAQLENRIQQKVHELNSQHALAEREIQKLTGEAAALPALRNQLQQNSARLRLLAEQDEALQKKRQSLQELQAQVNYLESGQHHLEQEIDGITEKLGMLTARTEAKCPLCETELGVDGIKLIEAKYDAEKQSKAALLKSNRDEIAQKKAAAETLLKEITQTEASLRQERTAIEHKSGGLTNQINAAEKASRELAEQKQVLAEIEQRLVHREFVSAEDAMLGEIDGDLTRLAYNPEEHEKLRQTLAELAPSEPAYRKAEEAGRLIEQERSYASRAEDAIARTQQSLANDEQKLRRLNEELVNLPKLITDLLQTESQYQELTRQRNQVQEKLGNARAKLLRCAELAGKRKEKSAAMAEAGRQEDIYKELAEAFGKSGIQALLIENALPEIEIEANRLLSRMTDNRMHLKFDTQRGTKTGGVIETLDIKISDDLGLRNYEMFSGGEAFRINFAVRIALSRLLARRAGAPLRTLIIDEGFGTQDSAGIEKLKEAINSIQDDFDKIIVITHIEDLRDAFPVRIDVTKTPDGSMVTVS